MHHRGLACSEAARGLLHSVGPHNAPHSSAWALPVCPPLASLVDHGEWPERRKVLLFHTCYAVVHHRYTAVAVAWCSFSTAGTPHLCQPGGPLGVAGWADAEEGPLQVLPKDLLGLPHAKVPPLQAAAPASVQLHRKRTGGYSRAAVFEHPCGTAVLSHPSRLRLLRPYSCTGGEGGQTRGYSRTVLFEHLCDTAVRLGYYGGSTVMLGHFHGTDVLSDVTVRRSQ